jgi:hypothetical protein
VIAAVGRAG